MKHSTKACIYAHTHTRMHTCTHTSLSTQYNHLLLRVLQAKRLVDNTVVCRIIHSTDDIQKLGEDLNILHHWTQDWFMLDTQYTAV